jgi:hypothetical protein
MSLRQKLIKETKSFGLLTLYFTVWFEMIVFVKWLVLAQYQIEFSGASLAFVGALIVAKVVIVAENISLGQWVRQRPVAVDVILRTLLYSVGVLVALVLEKAFEARHEAGGFGKAIVELIQHREVHHVWAETIFVGGSFLGFCIMSVVKRRFGGAELRRLFFATPLADLDLRPIEKKV